MLARHGTIIDSARVPPIVARQSTAEGSGNMRTFIIVATMIALLPATANSQMGRQEDPARNQSPFARTDAQKKKDAEVEKAYEEVLKADKAHTAPVKGDPWQSIRPAGDDTAKR